MYTKDSGPTIKQKEMEHISTKMAHLILENGTMISSMVTVIKNGLMEPNMKATIPKG